MTKGYDALLDDLSAYNERTKTATETYEQSLVSIVAATQEVVSERDNANKWASAPEDVLIDDGTNTPDYSANHYAKKAEATSQGVADLVQDATDQAAIAKDQADEATNQAGIAAANNILMPESHARALQTLNENRYAASSMVHMGKHRDDGSALTSVNEGMYLLNSTSNTVRMGVLAGTSGIKGESETNFPVLHLAGAVINILDLNAPTSTNTTAQFELPQAPDGTVTHNKSTGENIKHPDVATAFALADSDVNIEVVTHPVDLALLEYYEEEETGDRVEIFECIQSLSTTFGDTDVPTVLSTRPKSYFQQYDGQFSDPDAQNTTYRCVVWPDLTDEQKRKVAASMGEKLFMGENGNIVNGRLRARTIRGAGNGDWNNIDSTSSTYFRWGNGNMYVVSQGVSDVIPSGGNSLKNGGNSAYNYQGYNTSSSSWSNNANQGVFHGGNNNPAYKGRCFAYVVATVPRLNLGFYHENLNPHGSAADLSGEFWYNTSFDFNTTADCFDWGKVSHD